MSAVLEAEVPNEETPTESQLLDVLYEVLAQGVPAKGRLTSEQVERFLHEHARRPKSVAQMLEFFRAHELPTDPSAYGADPELRELASGLHRDRPPLSPTFQLAEQLEGPEPSARESGPMLKIEPAPVVMVEPIEVTQLAPAPGWAPPAVQRSWILPVACGVSLAFAAALLATYRHASDLKLQLVQARLQQQSTDTALSALEQRAETLRGALEASETHRKGLAARFDEFVSGEAQKRAAEEVALERLLGARFQTLRDRALQEAMVTPGR